jgi:hypothetical protein
MSFTATTKVLTASGALVAISKLKVGKKVLATNTKTGKTTAQAVTAVLVHRDTDRYDLRVKTAPPSSIRSAATACLRRPRAYRSEWSFGRPVRSAGTTPWESSLAGEPRPVTAPGDVWPAAQREVAEQADWYGKPIALKGGPDGNTDCGCSRR